MAIGKYFKDLTATTDIDALLGAAEKADGSPPGNKFTYSKTPDKATPSDAKVLTEGGVSDWATYTNPLPTTTAIGGIPAGSTFFNTPQSYADFIDAAAYTYINPAFTAFALSGYSIVEVGTEITGNQNFTWAISTVGNVQANSINILDLTNVLTLVTGHSVTSPATYDFSLYSGGGLKFNSPGSVTFQIQGTNTHSIQFTRNATVTAEWRRYWGFSSLSSLTGADVISLSSSDLSTIGAGTFSFGATGYKWFCIPSSFTQPTSFKDQATGLDVAMESPITVSVTNTLGAITNYSCYRTTNQLGSTITIIIS